MTRYLPLVAAILVVLGAGVVRARWAVRQADTRDLQQAAAHLADVPLVSGDWEATRGPFDLDAYKAAGIHGALVHNYKNRVTGQELVLMIVCGRPGSIAAHTPDVCYPSAGFEMLSDHIRVIPDEEASRPDLFWKLRMGKKKALTPQILNVTYGWTADGLWQAPERDARWAFADIPVLFKLYAIRPVPASIAERGAAFEAKTDPTADFLKAVLPDVNRALFPSQAPAQAQAPSQAEPPAQPPPAQPAS